MAKGILYTRHDGGVSISYPTSEIIRVMQVGGYWNDRPRGFIQTQIERQIADGIPEFAAVRYANAVTFGGCTEAEGWGIIRDRDCLRHGTLHELIDTEELPPDRWFRDAWYRSSNGGPVAISLEKARPIQWDRLRRAVERENKKRREAFDELPEIQIDKSRIKSAIKHARDDEELRRVWVEGVTP